MDLVHTSSKEGVTFWSTFTNVFISKNKPSPTLLICFLVFARWQHYIRRRSVLSDNGKESFNPILDPDADPDHHQKSYYL